MEKEMNGKHGAQETPPEMQDAGFRMQNGPPEMREWNSGMQDAGSRKHEARPGIQDASASESRFDRLARCRRAERRSKGARASGEPAEPAEPTKPTKPSKPEPSERAGGALRAAGAPLDFYGVSGACVASTKAFLGREMALFDAVEYAAHVQTCPYFRFHALRHSGASVMENANAPVGSIRRILGHENRQTTEIYLHSLGESERRAMEVYEGARNFSHTDSHTVLRICEK